MSDNCILCKKQIDMKEKFSFFCCPLPKNIDSNKRYEISFYSCEKCFDVILSNDLLFKGNHFYEIDECTYCSNKFKHYYFYICHNGFYYYFCYDCFIKKIGEKFANAYMPKQFKQYKKQWRLMHLASNGISTNDEIPLEPIWKSF